MKNDTLTPVVTKEQARALVGDVFNLHDEGTVCANVVNVLIPCSDGDLDFWAVYISPVIDSDQFEYLHRNLINQLPPGSEIAPVAAAELSKGLMPGKEQAA